MYHDPRTSSNGSYRVGKCDASPFFVTSATAPLPLPGQSKSNPLSIQWRLDRPPETASATASGVGSPLAQEVPEMKQQIKRAARALVLSAQLYRELAVSASTLLRRPAP
jgi:hypothetical protein